MQKWSELVFSDEVSFDLKAQKVFKYQFENNPVYQRYCEALGMTADQIKGESELLSGRDEIPLLPIKAFKDTTVAVQTEAEVEVEFKSSGTSQMQRSVHQVVDAKLYDQSLLRGFKQFYPLNNAVVWGYTPGYSENPASSLTYMIQRLVEEDGSGLSRFQPLDEPLDKSAVDEVKRQGKKLILFGAAFGLLDLLEMKRIPLPSDSIVIETGGMKTHRREISRAELHGRLARGFDLDTTRIHSEYGMAELLSQAYATGGQWFRTVPWMDVSIRDPDNPAEKLPPFEEGRIGIIDLANIYSCSFLLTGDRGMTDKNGRFQVLGRWNPKDPRGCNFLIEED